MNKPTNWEEAKAKAMESKSFQIMPAGGYVCTITRTEELANNTLKVEYDITEGEWQWTAKETYERTGIWFYSFVRSWNGEDWQVEAFAKFTSSVEASNNGYTFDWNAESLEGKDVGLVLGIENYVKNNGDLGQRHKVKAVMSADDIRKGNFKVPKETWTDDAKALIGAKEALGFDTMEQADADNPFA